MKVQKFSQKKKIKIQWVIKKMRTQADWVPKTFFFLFNTLKSNSLHSVGHPAPISKHVLSWCYCLWYHATINSTLIDHTHSHTQFLFCSLVTMWMRLSVTHWGRFHVFAACNTENIYRGWKKKKKNLDNILLTCFSFRAFPKNKWEEVNGLLHWILWVAALIYCAYLTAEGAEMWARKANK